MAAWSAKCFWVVNAWIDPIGSYGVSPSDHMHSFAGALNPTDTLEPIDLRGVVEPNECRSPELDGDMIDDKSQYWAPSLRSTNVPGTWGQPAEVLIYYRNAGVDPNTIRAFNRDFSMRAGEPEATTGQGARVIRWSCVADKKAGVPDNEVQFGARIPATCPKYLGGDEDYPFSLRLVVYFENCVNFDTVQRIYGQWRPRDPVYAARIANPVNPDHTRACADAGYDAIPQVQIGFRWRLNTGMGVVDAPNPEQWNLSSLGLSSDHAGQTRGVSGHADFMSGWTTDHLGTLMRACYWDEDHNPPGESDAPRNCGTIGQSTLYGEN